MTLIIITGPTASGKTGISIDIAEKIGGEIVGADSIQIYKDLVIGSAAPSSDEMKGIAHHLVGTHSLSDEINAGKYITEAKSAVNTIISKGKIPVMTGGTNFYVDAFLNGLSPVPEISSEEKNIFEKSLEGVDTETLYRKLLETDPVWAAGISSPNDRQRIHRGLEVLEITGIKLSEWNRMPRINGYQGDFLVIGIDIDREILYKNINRRAEKMVFSGLVDEVRKINMKGYSINNCKPLGSIGYKETALFLNGEIATEQELADTISLNTRHLAKRQMTWLKNRNYIKWERNSSIIESVFHYLTRN